jgi:hypothetical protein
MHLGNPHSRRNGSGQRQPQAHEFKKFRKRDCDEWLVGEVRSLLVRGWHSKEDRGRGIWKDEWDCVKQGLVVQGASAAFETSVIPAITMTTSIPRATRNLVAGGGSGLVFPRSPTLLSRFLLLHPLSSCSKIQESPLGQTTLTWLLSMPSTLPILGQAMLSLGRDSIPQRPWL